MDLYDLPEDIQPIAIRAAGLREQNVALFRQLEELGGGAELGVARVEHALVFLADIGIITEKQRWEEAAGWEQVLREQLKTGIEQIKGIRAQAQEEFEAQQRRAKLLAP